ncbi:NADPH-dependent FMN reductase [Natribacillus halophilus]|uniref:FMN reductase n=1 Tax=Natribacillus halophilus TaxID=549003 RepID=A0A1G8KR61_9BACI|nr:NADPH-dependent FMN reductase [Natribacillus halophilus]SDI45839.1 FMN reductase [Natribacillus halophilus]
MNIVALSGSNVGSKTRAAMDYTVNTVAQKYPETGVTLIDLADFEIQFSDGRHFLDYEGDTQYVAKTIVEADAIIIGTPIFQASIPATLKNIFDLLPQDGLRDKVVSVLVTAGSLTHFLIVEQQLKPILSYMKAQIVQDYVFIEEQNIHRKEITNDDVSLRIDRLVEDTVGLTETYMNMRKAQEEAYGF